MKKKSPKKNVSSIPTLSYLSTLVLANRVFKDPDLEATANNTVQVMEDNFSSHLETNRDILFRLYGILTINAFEIPNAGEGNLGKTRK